MAELHPQSMTHVRNDGRQRENRDFQRFLTNAAPLHGIVGKATDRIEKLHHGGDRGVEVAPAADVIRRLGERVVRDPPQLALQL